MENETNDFSENYTQKKYVFVWFQKDCPKFFTCITLIDKTIQIRNILTDFLPYWSIIYCRNYWSIQHKSFAYFLQPALGVCFEYIETVIEAIRRKYPLKIQKNFKTVSDKVSHSFKNRGKFCCEYRISIKCILLR